MLEISPIFNDRLECQPFMQMVFFDSRKDLACMPSPFLASQFRLAAVGGRDVTPFSSHCNSARCLVKILPYILKIFYWLKM
jgi:hypothetical protein